MHRDDPVFNEIFPSGDDWTIAHLDRQLSFDVLAEAHGLELAYEHQRPLPFSPHRAAAFSLPEGGKALLAEYRYPEPHLHVVVDTALFVEHRATMIVDMVRRSLGLQKEDVVWCADESERKSAACWLASPDRQPQRRDTAPAAPAAG